jgi:parallel beta-helix repeat protein
MLRMRCVMTISLSLALTVVFLMFLSPAQAAPRATNRFVISNPPLSPVPACTQNDPCSLWRALNLSSAGDTIFIGGGTYTNTGNGALITVSQSITLYGGWTGTGTDRNPKLYQSVLDGQNRRRVVLAAGNIRPTLDGLYLTRGLADYGGGLLVQSAQPVIRDCQIYSNTASIYGGGVYLNGGQGAQLDSNVINNNTAMVAGGVGVNSHTALTLTDNLIRLNTAQQGGGLVIYAGNDNWLHNNRVRDNTAVIGGGLFITQSLNVKLEGTYLINNAASDQTGGLLVVLSPGTLISGSIIYSNTASDLAGGVYVFQSEGTELIGNDIHDNTGRRGGRRAGGIQPTGPCRK